MWCQYGGISGRKPWQYRPAGSAIIKGDSWMPYPRVCAHRGFSAIAPENSMPAFGAAIALGAEEIEFDLWPTKDGEIVSCHDSILDRVSDGSHIQMESDVISSGLMTRKRQSSFLRWELIQY